MSWRENMGVEKKSNLLGSMDNMDNMDKTPSIETEKDNFVHSVHSVHRVEKVKKIKIEPMATDCPARCKRTGLCYGRPYFLGKSGKGAACTPDGCPYDEYRQTYYKNQTPGAEWDELNETNVNDVPF